MDKKIKELFGYNFSNKWEDRKPQLRMWNFNWNVSDLDKQNFAKNLAKKHKPLNITVVVIE